MAWTPPETDEIVDSGGWKPPESDAIVDAAKPADLSQLGQDPYDKFKLQELQGGGPNSSFEQWMTPERQAYYNDLLRKEMEPSIRSLTPWEKFKSSATDLEHKLLPGTRPTGQPSPGKALSGAAMLLPVGLPEGLASKAALGYFGYNTLKAQPDYIREIASDIKSGDYKQAARSGTEDLLNLTMLGASARHLAGSKPTDFVVPDNTGRDLKMPPVVEPPPPNVESFTPLDAQSGAPLSPQELIARQSRVPTPPEPTQPEIKTYNLDEETGGQNASQVPSSESTAQREVRPPVGESAPLRQQGETPGTQAQANEPVARAGDARGENDQGEVTSSDAAKLLGKPFITQADVESMPVSELADAKLGHQAGQIAGLDAKPSDVPALEKKYAQAQKDAIDSVKAAMSAHQTGDADKISAANTTQLANSGKSNFYAGMLMSATKGEFKGTGSNREGFLSQLEKAKISSPELVGMGAAKYGETTGPHTPIGELDNQIHIMSESSPEASRQKEAFNLGEKLSGLKDGVSESLSGLKSAGQYLKQKFIGEPIFGDFKKAIGNRHLSLTDSAINARVFAKNAEKKIPSKLTQEAISDYVDAGGNEDVLRRAASETKSKYRRGYEAALNLTPEQKTLAANIKQYFETRLDDAQKAGILEDGIEDYIHRYYPSDTPWKRGILAELRSGISTATPALAKQRVFDYDFEAEKAGLKPEKSFIKRVAAYDLSLNKAIADRNIVKEMGAIKMPDGRPMVDVSGAGVPTGDPVQGQGATLIKPKAKPNSDAPIDNRGDYRPFDYPALRKWKWAGTDANGNPIMLQGDVLVHPEAIKDVKALFERSKIRQNPLGRLALNASSTVKQTMLDLSLFHPVQIAVHGLEHRSHVPFGEFDAKFLGKEYRPLTDYLKDDNVRKLVRGGMVMGETTGREMFHEGLSGSSLTKHIPVLGPKLNQYTDWLFNDYIPRLKAETGLHALERNRKRFPNLSEDALAHLTANEMNAAFGEQNYEMIGRSKTMQDALRLGLLAPDFLESRLKFAGQAATVHGREQLQALGLGAATMYLIARLLNKAMDGEYHFEPKNAFSVIHNGKAYSLRTVQGDILQAATDPEKFARHRLNPLFGRTAIEAITQRDEFGRTRNAQQQLKDFATTIVPISARGVLNPREQDLFESTLNAVGVTEHRATSSGLIYDLANKYKQKHKIAQEPGEFIYDPEKDPYRAIKQAATFSSPQTVAAEIKRSVASGEKPQKLITHFNRYATAPFTGSKKSESDFFKSLDSDNQKIYRDAKLEKQKVLRNFQAGLSLWRRGATNNP